METDTPLSRLLRVAVLIVLALHTGSPAAGEEPKSGEEPDPQRLLEGLAPLARHGPWKLEKKDDRSPKPMDPPAELPEAHRVRFGKGLTRTTKHTYSIKPDVGWSQSINLVVFRFSGAREAADFRAAQRFYWSHPTPGIRKIGGHVRSVTLAGGTLTGFSLSRTRDVETALLSITGQVVQSGRTVLMAIFVQSDHISPATATAFIEYAFQRLSDPAAKPPPSPSMDLGLREVRLIVEPSGGGDVGSVDLMWRRVAGGKFGAPVRVGPPLSLTLPRAAVQLRVGHARSPGGTPLPVLGSDVLVGATAERATCKLPKAPTMRIRVQGPEGRPLAGASVQTISRPLPRLRFAVVVMGEEQHQEEKIPDEVGDGRGQTDAAGWITLPVHPKKRSRVITRKGRGFMPAQAWVDPGTETHLVVLKPAWTLEAVVTDQAGRPLKCYADLRIGNRRHNLTTDDEGRFVLGPIPRQGIFIRIHPEHGWDGLHDRRWQRIEPTNEVHRLTVPCHQVDLRVVGPDGKPVPQCWLDLKLPSDGSAHGSTLRGATRIAVPLAWCRLEVRKARDEDDSPLNLREAGTYVKPGTGAVTLRMEEGRAIRGTILDPEGRPVAGAEVRASVGWDTLGETTTDDAGRFVIIGLDDRRVTLKVDSPSPLAPTLARNVAPTKGEQHLELRLPKAVPITVEDGAGNPVSHAYVALWAGEGAGELHFEAHTDDAGRVYFPDLGLHQEIAVQMQNGEPLGDARQVWDGQPLTVRLPRALKAKVLVVDEKGPVVNADVQIEDLKIRRRATGPSGRVTIRRIPESSKRARARRTIVAPWSPWVPLHEAPFVTRIQLAEADR